MHLAARTSRCSIAVPVGGADIDVAAFAAVEVRGRRDIGRAARAFRDVVMEIGGYRAMVSHNIASKAPMRDEAGEILAAQVFGFNAPHEQWWSDPVLALHSPIARACRYESEPFWIGRAGIFTRTANPYLAGIDLAEVAAIPWPALIVVPIYLPFGQIGVGSFVSSAGDGDDLSAAFEAHGDVLARLSQRFVSSYVKITQNREWLPPNCWLTKREVECLRWAAMGKTDGEIASILGRSRSTVRFHNDNSAKKLNSVTRGQTILKAAQLGYLALAR